MRAVNLLPRQAADKKFAVDRALVIGVALTLIVAAAIAGGFFMEKANAATAKQRLVSAQAALRRAEQQQPTKNSPAPARLTIPVVLSQKEPWHVAFDSALATRTLWDELLQKLEYVVPDTVRLTTVTLGSAGGTTAGAPGGSISIGGTAYSQADIANFLSTLARVPDLTQVTLTSTATNVGTNTITFQITAQLIIAGTPVPANEYTSTKGGW